MDTYALIVAAGKAIRFGGELPKQFVEVCGRPLLSWAISRFEQAESISGIVVVVDEAYAGSTASHVIDPYGYHKVRKIVSGGDTRQRSVANGLAALGKGVRTVAIHDGARPLVRPGDIDRVVEAASSGRCAMLATPITDTVKRVEGMRIVTTVDRRDLYAAQTPQAFPVDLIRSVHASAADHAASDDSVLVEGAGQSVQIVVASGPNIKVTTPDDLLIVEAFLKREHNA